MRVDKDYMFFCDHSDWYEFDIDIGYVPTKNAPKEAVVAMDRFNKRMKERIEQGYED